MGVEPRRFWKRSGGGVASSVAFCAGSGSTPTPSPPPSANGRESFPDGCLSCSFKRHPLKLSPLAALSLSSFDMRNFGSMLGWWRSRPSTTLARPTVSAQNIGPPV